MRIIHKNDIHRDQYHPHDPQPCNVDDNDKKNDANNDDDDDDVQSEDSTVLFLHDCSSWTVRMAPVREPMRWLIVNIFWTITSMMIMIDMIVSYHHERARVVAEELYILYNGASTTTWCLEVSLSVLERRFVRQKYLTWPIKAEVCLAICFLFGSVQEIMAWQVHEEDIRGDIWSTLLSIFAYIYESIRCYKHHQKQIQRQQHNETITMTTVQENENAITNYRTMMEQEGDVVVPIPRDTTSQYHPK